MKARHLLILLISLPLPLSVEASIFSKFFHQNSDFGDYPIRADVAETIRLDQNFNIPSRQREILRGADLVAKPMFHYDVPIDEVTLIESKFIDPYIYSKVILAKPEGTFVRIFTFDGRDLPSKKWIKAGYNFGSKYVAMKMQSHSTYILWDPLNLEYDPFYVKMSIRLNGVLFTSSNFAKKAIFMNNLLQKSIGHDAGADSFLSESIATVIAAKGKKSVNIFRSYSPASGPLGPNIRLVPLHGFLGCNDRQIEASIINIAEKMNMSVIEWQQKEYLPKLARWHARLNFGLGIYLEGHTQNTLIKVRQ